MLWRLHEHGTGSGGLYDKTRFRMDTLPMGVAFQWNI
jgi:hypothetical protein